MGEGFVSNNSEACEVARAETWREEMAGLLGDSAVGLVSSAKKGIPVGKNGGQGKDRGVDSGQYTGDRGRRHTAEANQWQL